MNDQTPRFVLCLDHGGNPVSLEVGKLYRVVEPHDNDPADWVRVIDEDGEDYVYPAKMFVAVELAPEASRRYLEAIAAGSEAA